MATNWNSFIVHVDRTLAEEEGLILGIVESSRGNHSFSSIPQLVQLLSLPEPQQEELDVSTVELSVQDIPCPCCENSAS